MRNAVLMLACCLCCAAALAQSAEEKVFEAKQAELVTKIKDVLQREDDRARQDTCGKAGDNVSFQNCVSREFAQTDRNYTTLVLNLGAVLRLPDPGAMAGTPPVKPGRISFDDAETGWQTYRKQVCDAVYKTYGLGTMGPGAFVDCEVKVTRSHMHELVTLLGVWNR